VKVTEELERKIHGALEMVDGSVAQAAVLLDVDAKELHNAIAGNKNLRVRWKTGAQPIQPPGDAVVIHRDILPLEPSEDGILMDERKIAEAIEAEDAAVKKGLSTMGVDESMLNLSVAFRDFTRKHFNSALQVISGGIVRQYLDTVGEINRITAKLKDGNCEDKITPAQELMLREDRSRLQEFSQKLYKEILKSVLIAAKVKALQSKGKGNGGAGPEKPKGYLNIGGNNADES
jgi:hypothetical protein